VFPEDDILHLRSAKSLDPLLADHPADGIRNVALSAAVRAHDSRDAFFVQSYCRGITKGLEPLNGDFFDSEHEELPDRLQGHTTTACVESV
jgi:hypothetical protein